MRLDIDTANSSIVWKASKVTVNTKHHGHIAIASGWVDIDDYGVLSAGEIVADMNSIKDDDLENEAMNKTLTNHLKSADFFDAASYPTATLTVRKVNTRTSEATVQADLMIRGKSNSVEFPAHIEKHGEKWEAKATLTVDRTRWEIKYGSGKFFKGLGDKLIHDTFDLEVHLVTK